MDLSPLSTAGLVAIIASAVLSVLFNLAGLIRNHAEGHDLKVRVATLRMEYFKRVERREQGVMEVGEAVSERPAR